MIALSFRRIAFALLATIGFALPAVGQEPLRIFISVDVEGLGGVGTGAMTGSSGKDYAVSRRLATDEVNAVVEAIFAHGPAEILVNDSHGDMQNVLHTELDPRVQYIQGAIKPLGMVEGMNASFDGAIFLGYHSRAGTAEGFLAHTGSGSVKGLWINDLEVGEGEWNALLAGSFGVPVIVAAGDSAFVEQFSANVPGAQMVTTKTAITPVSARLLHPSVVHERLVAATNRALADIDNARPLDPGNPVRVRVRLADVTTPQILQAIPGVRQVDGYTVEFTSPTMEEAYKLIRFVYRFVSV